MAKKQTEFQTPSKYLTPVSSGNGRPKLILNEEGKQMVEILAGYLCTDEEIAGTLKTSVDVLTNGNNREAFSEAKKKGIAKAKVSIRRNQMKLSEKSAAMAIFLGKNYLGQRDSVEYEDRESIARLDAILAGMKHAAAKPETK